MASAAASEKLKDRDVCVVGVARTPMGGFLGALSSFSATKLGSIAIQTALKRAHVDPSLVQEVYFGNVLSANLGQAPARQAALGAGIPNTVVCTTVNKVCASGMKATMLAAQSIQLGINDIVVAGGMESMSNAPKYISEARKGSRFGHDTLVDGMLKDGLWDVYGDCAMGNCAELCADNHSITREEQDSYAVRSNECGIAARDSGAFAWEIAPVEVPGGRGKPPITVDKDESLEKFDPLKLKKLRPSFKENGGTVTAGNASSLSDGAAALVLMSGEKAQDLGLQVIAKITGYADAAQAPELFTTAPAVAIPKAIVNAGLEASQVDFYEINEAFAVVALANQNRTIVIALLLYILGLGLLASSSVVPALRPPKCSAAFFFSSLYLMAFARGFSVPCIQAFGADQFDQNDPAESTAKSSFFSWSYMSMCVGASILSLPLVFVQENIGWGIGIGIPCAVVLLALIAFLAGTRTYRFCSLGHGSSPFARLRRATTTLVRGWRSKPASDGEAGHTEEIERHQDEEARRLLRLFPIAATCLISTVVSAQYATFFTKQGRTLDRRVRPNLEVPPAALQIFIAISMTVFIPTYERIIVPLARKLTKIPTGFTVLQRTGIGKVVLIITMVIAALVETKRLKTARDAGLVDAPDTTLPMSCWWLVPQYVVFGIADALMAIGLSEFYYDQSPDSLRSIGIGLSQVFLAMGNFLSGFLVSAIDEATKKGGDGWLSDNLNRAHLDYFYWLLAGLGALEFAVYVVVARAYVYNKKTNSSM